MGMNQTKTAQIMLVKAVDVIDRKIMEIREESYQYSETLMAHLNGTEECRAGRFDWNRKNLTKCTDEIKVLKTVRRTMLDLGAEKCERCGGDITTGEDGYKGCETCGEQNMEDR